MLQGRNGFLLKKSSLMQEVRGRVCCNMLQREYILSRIGFDTAENEPSKVMFLCFKNI